MVDVVAPLLPHRGTVTIATDLEWRKGRVESLLGSVMFAVVAGLTIGIGTQILQGLLPRNIGQLSNSGAVWALGAVVVGAAMRSERLAAAAGGAALVIASYSYYGAVDRFEHLGSNGTSARMWAVIGLAVGPVFGVLGQWIRADAARRWAALAVIAGMLIGEGAELVWFVGVHDLWPAGITEMAVGGIVGLVSLANSGRGRPSHLAPADRLLSLGAGSAAAVVTLVAMHAIGGGAL